MRRSATIKVCGVILVSFLAIFLGCFAHSKITSIRQKNTLIAFAEELGYTPKSHLAQYKACTGWALPPYCKQILYYSTSLDLDQLQLLVEQFVSTKDLPRAVEGYSLLDINLVTKTTIGGEKNSGFTVDGNFERISIPEPLAFSWWLEKGGKDWIVTFYDIANDGHIYKLDGQQVHGNIITIKLLLE